MKLQFFGGYGYMPEYEVERYYRDVGSDIYGGTREIRKT
jgi:alkylation response protein AidB-like acyl-CoA dehydrogenase